MKILLINANTSAWVTERLAGVARASASPGTEIHAVTGRLGAPVIGSRAEAALAAHSSLELAARHHQGCDAVLIGVSLDCGLEALRESLPVPVVGMTEAALLTACLVGGRLGVLVLGQRNVPLYRELIAGYGLEHRLAAMEALPVEAAELRVLDQTFEARVLQGLLHLVHGAGAEVLMVAGAVTAGMASRLQDRLPVPLLEPIGCGVLQAELLVRLRLLRPETGSYSPMRGRPTAGLDAALTDFLGVD